MELLYRHRAGDEAGRNKEQKMSKQNLKVAVSEAISFLAKHYKVSEIMVLEEMKSGNRKLIEDYSKLLTHGMNTI